MQSLADRYCDPRASLLLAAALEAQGDASAAEAALRLAHTHWPANNSIAASLSRQYMASGQVSRAGQALAHFHATADTPMQEMELATVVFIADHQLVPARTVAETAYRAHPSLRSLLLLANAMQLQGRFKDVVAMLNAKRSLYKDSAPFLITLAESEFDSILYGAAQRDLQQALVLDPGSYQAHFLLGNALLKLDHADEAAGEYRRAIALSPQQPRTYYQLALALQAQQDQPGAEEQLTKALALDAHYGPALIEISKMLIAQHRPRRRGEPIDSGYSG